jgi:hypothetical protein
MACAYDTATPSNYISSNTILAKLYTDLSLNNFGMTIFIYTYIRICIHMYIDTHI